MVDASGCTCLEVFGEDPNCPMHSYEALENRILDLEILIESQHGDVVFRTAKLLYDKDACIAELEAENERLKKEVSANHNLAMANGQRAKEEHDRAEALSHTGAVKVKALEWEAIDGGNAFRAPALIFGWIRIETYTLHNWQVQWSVPGICNLLMPNVFKSPDEAKAAAQADYERRILSAITTEPAAPEGRQEAWRIGDAVLDWMVKFDLLDAGNEYYVSDVLAVLNDLTPSTRPSEQAVTEAIRRIRDYADKPHADRYVIRNMAEKALKAAMEAGR